MARSYDPVRTRFLRGMPVPDGGCWFWKGIDKGGEHPNIRTGEAGGRSIKAHRLSFEMFIGPVPDGLSVLHRCDKPRCCNPDHLFLGTVADNMKDMAIKYRGNKSKSGFPFGAKPDGNKWLSICNLDGRKHYLGCFHSAEEASARAVAFKQEAYSTRRREEGK